MLSNCLNLNRLRSEIYESISMFKRVASLCLQKLALYWLSIS